MTREERRKYYYDLTHRINGNNEEEKYCNNCETWKVMNLDNFYKSGFKNNDGFSSQCKECAKEKAKINKRNNKERYSEYDRQYRNRDKNKEIMNERSRQWMVDHKEYTKEFRGAWGRSEIGKAWLMNWMNERELHQHDISQKEWEANKKYFNNECAYCGMPLELHKEIVGQDLHKEHKDHDGANDLSNCVPACRLCNSTKHDKEFDDWYNEFNPNYTQKRYNKIIKWCTEDYKYYIEDKPPYRIIKERNKHNNKFHWNLWTVDEHRNIIKCILTKDKRKEIINEIEKGNVNIHTLKETAK